MDDFLDSFLAELKNKELDDELIDSLKELIESDEFSSDNIVDFIEGVFNEQQ